MGSTFLTTNQLINPDLSKTIMNRKVLFLFAATAILMSDGASLRRERRSLGLIKLGAKAAATAAGVAAAKPLALGLLGKCKNCYRFFQNVSNIILDALYKWLTSGTNAGITAEGGLGPLKKKLSAGFEYGVPKYGVPEAVAPGPDGEFWYEPLDGVDGDAVPVVIDAEAWVPAGSEGEFLEPVYNDNAGDLLGAQGGFQLGPLSLNAGIGAGR